MSSDKTKVIVLEDSETVLRRIPASQMTPDEKVPGGKRPSSGAFSISSPDSNTSKPGMSLDWKDIILKDNIDPLTRHKESEFSNQYLYQFKVEILSSADAKAHHEPIDGNQYHCNAYNKDTSKNKFSGSQQRKMYTAAEKIYEPTES